MSDPAFEAQWTLMLNDSDEIVRTIAARAAIEPTLRVLFPYASLSDLRFSTTSTYPYSESPYISVAGNGVYRARDRDHRPLLEGTLDEVVAEVVRAISRG